MPESKHVRRPGGMIAAGAAAVAALFAFAALGGVGVGQSAIGAAQYQYGKKVTICHKAGPNKRVTITVSVNAWPAHQRHGDTLGACQQAAATNKGKGKGSKGKGNSQTSSKQGSSSSKGQGKGKSNGKGKSSGSSGSTTGASSGGNGNGKGKGNGQK